MDLFDLIFSPSMLIMPMVFMQFYRPRPGAEVDMVRVRKLRRRLTLGTVLSLLVFACLFTAHSAGRSGSWESYPRTASFASTAYNLVWMAFFPLWFVLAMPLLKASRPEAASVFADSRGQVRQARSASLTPRVANSPASARARTWMIGLWILGAVLTGVFVWQRHGELVAGNSQYWLLAALGLPLALLPALLFPSLQRSLSMEAEPLPHASSPDLELAYADLRMAKARGLFTLGLAMELLVLSAVVLSVAAHSDTNLGTIAGATAGSALGVAGAVFGTVMSNRRMRIQRLLNDLTE